MSINTIEELVAESYSDSTFKGRDDYLADFPGLEILQEDTVYEPMTINLSGFHDLCRITAEEINDASGVVDFHADCAIMVWTGILLARINELQKAAIGRQLNRAQYWKPTPEIRVPGIIQRAISSLSLTSFEGRRFYPTIRVPAAGGDIPEDDVFETIPDFHNFSYRARHTWNSIPANKRPVTNPNFNNNGNGGWIGLDSRLPARYIRWTNNVKPYVTNWAKGFDKTISRDEEQKLWVLLVTGGANDTVVKALAPPIASDVAEQFFYRWLTPDALTTTRLMGRNRPARNAGEEVAAYIVRIELDNVDHYTHEYRFARWKTPQIGNRESRMTSLISRELRLKSPI